MKFWRISFYGLGIVPVAFIVSLMAFYLHAGLILGQFPKYNQPDPKDIAIYSDYSPFIIGSGNIWIISFFVWIGMTVAYFILKKDKINWNSIIFSTLVQLAAVLLFLSGISEWFAD